ncbi:mechanosensitive ion channel family protein [Rhodoferax antarcticus]|uniref:Mechanosensitive ion channel family protein n=1 Tax=Rhodoferax antarcticus ANT.BR TaxID=1111071 RepID=A0A1Q8YHM7_9BURK|nr:mechanosensitive ion channel family protein [Rhodoferax antarcticus]APW45178.1 mechanosensitive ion channel protein MscS [Rhodoferax antarcticus]MCW2310922.1 MscS family membrane protein [Rhodoferax antarcticus]OLP07429.1 mechanosensitive ion channel family protein [Rhodoferax antarcticus ANT.BR]
MQLYYDFVSDNFGMTSWVATVLAMALATLVIHYLLRIVLKRASHITVRTQTVWDDALVNSAAKPVLLAFWLISAGLMARVLQRESEVEFLTQGLVLRDVALIVAVAWFLLRFSGKVGRNILVQRAANGDDVDPTTIDALVKLTRLLTVVVAMITIAQTLGFHIGGLLALGGVGGLAVGLAAKDLLANFFGGLTIYLDRPFGVGEWIRSPDKSIEGTVEYISWRHTRIRAFNKNPIYVPNAVFTSIIVENPSRMSHRRLKETIGVRYDDFDKVAIIVADIRLLLQAHPGIDTSQTMIVNFNLFGPSSLDIMVYTFTKTTDWIAFHGVKQEVLLQIGECIKRHGAQIAFPTRTLHLETEASAQMPTVPTT